MTLITPTVLPEDEVTRRALLELMGNLNKEGIASGMLVTPLYDDMRDISIALVGGVEQDAGPYTPTLSTWVTYLTVTLALDPGGIYRIYGTASLDIHLTSGSAFTTVEMRVNSGVSTKAKQHSSRASSEAPEDYASITVPFSEEVSTDNESYTADLDAQVYATVSSDPIEIENLQLVVMAIPVLPSVEDPE